MSKGLVALVEHMAHRHQRFRVLDKLPRRRTMRHEASSDLLEDAIEDHRMSEQSAQIWLRDRALSCKGLGRYLPVEGNFS